jgi:hypothetical protein
VFAYIQFPVVMRIAPPLIDVSSLRARGPAGGEFSLSVGYENPTTLGAFITGTTSGGTAYNPSFILISDGFIGFGAEL